MPALSTATTLIMSSSLELFHHGSSACAAKVRFALDEKHLSWTGHYLDILKGEQFSAEYLAINPKAVVPTLRHAGHVITESTIICEYLDEVFPDCALYPADPFLRAEVRYWTKAVDEELHPACSALTYVVSHRHTILRNGVAAFDDFVNSGDPAGKTARLLKWQWIQEGLEAPGAADKILLYVSYLNKMEATLAHQDWLVGNAFSIADVAMAPYLNRLAALAMHPLWADDKLPRVADWFSRIQARPAFVSAIQQWVPEELRKEMYHNGSVSWPQISALLEQ